MECAERGLIDAPWLRFGDGRGAAARARRDRRARRGLGALLAQGSRRGGRVVGQDSIDFAPQVKGMELPGYEPRTLQAMALGLAVNARGADHNRSGAYEADLSGELDRLDGGAAHVAAAIDTEDRAAVMDSMILCKFLRGVFDDPFAGVGRAARDASPAGTSTPTSCTTTARRIVLAKRAFNQREGWHAPRTTGCRPGCWRRRWSWAPAATARRSPRAAADDGRRLLRRPRARRRPAPSGVRPADCCWRLSLNHGAHARTAIDGGRDDHGAGPSTSVRTITAEIDGGR